MICFDWLIVASKNTLKYDDVYGQSGPTNTTVYCGGIQSELTGRSFLIRVNYLGYLTVYKIIN